MSDPNQLENELLEGFAALNANMPAEHTLSPAKKASIKDRIMQRVGHESIPGAYTLYGKDEGWTVFLPGIMKKHLHSDSVTGGDMHLLKIDRGAVLPAHYHEKTERCLVLEGEMDFDRIHIAQGDFHIIEAGYEHPAGTTQTGAVLLINTL